MSFFSKIIEKILPVEHKQVLESDEQTIAQTGTEKQRHALALNARTSQQALFYMAENDPSPKVRNAVAANPSTPMQAAPILATDRAEDVRLTLARRVMSVLPALSEDKYSQLYAFAVQSLGELALDEVLKIRRALAETLKDHAHTPPSIALQLAKDLEREVSEPILRFCTALSDDGLIEILKTHPAHWASEAVARRKTVSGRVSEAIIDTGNRKAGQYLIQNESAVVSSNLLETIIERAREYPEWHKPIATRAELTPLMAQKLAAFVDKSVRKILMERSDLDAETIERISEIMQRRVDYQGTRREEKANQEDPIERATKLFQSGDLNENLIGDAVAMGDSKFVMTSLALMNKTTIETIQKVFDVRAPKAICAICWKAGLSMRLALQLQQTMGNVAIAALIYPRGGTDYPFTKEELEWQLGVIGIPI